MTWQGSDSDAKPIGTKYTKVGTSVRKIELNLISRW